LTKITSTEKTEDLIYRLEVKKGAILHDPDEPHLLIFEKFIEPEGIFHSMDVTMFRDGQRANDIDFRNFEHVHQPNMTYVKFTFYDERRQVTEHDYLLTIILRYLISA